MRIKLHYYYYGTHFMTLEVDWMILLLHMVQLKPTDSGEVQNGLAHMPGI